MGRQCGRRGGGKRFILVGRRKKIERDLLGKRGRGRSVVGKSGAWLGCGTEENEHKERGKKCKEAIKGRLGGGGRHAYGMRRWRGVRRDKGAKEGGEAGVCGAARRGVAGRRSVVDVAVQYFVCVVSVRHRNTKL